MIELKDCIGKYIYGKDGAGYEVWAFNLKSYTVEDWGGDLISEQGIFSTSSDGYFDVNVSYGDDEYEGDLTILAAYDTPQELMDCIMRRFREELKKAGYDIDQDPASAQGNSIQGTYYSTIKLSDLKLIGKYVAAKYGHYSHWFFGIQNIKKTKNEWEIGALMILNSSSDDDVCTFGKSITQNIGDMDEVSIYDNPQALLGNIEGYIKEVMEMTSGLKW